MNKDQRNVLLAVLSVVLVLVLIGIAGPAFLSAISLNSDNPPINEMREYYNAHRDDFARAADILIPLAQDCTYTCNAPDEISAWAGPDAMFYFCDGKEIPPLYDIITGGGTFTYIPGQVGVPTHWSPCVGVRATCSDRIADNWFRCTSSFD